jgi:transcriptional regulator with XRE-family HTH domain
MESPSYEEAVAAFVRSFRKARGLTLDAVARAGREFGATWNASSIQNIERGQASLTIPTLMYLALALGHLSGKPLKLIDLLGPIAGVDDPTVVPRGRVVPLSWVERALSGGDVELTDDDYQQARRASAAVNLCRDSGALSATLAETRAAKKLGLTTGELQQQAIRHWGRSLEEEALDRAGKDRTPQGRGRVTRVLVAEIQESMVAGG